MKIQIGHKLFKNKKEAIQFCWSFIKQNKGRITDSSDIIFLRDLISQHINSQNKIGCGIEYFYVAKSPDCHQKCIYVMRKDGSYTDFGVSNCFASKRTMNEGDMRRIVQYQIDAYKSRFNGQNIKTFKSEFSGKLFPVEKMNCDHEIPFKWIAEKFCEIYGVNLKEDVMYKKDNDSTASFSREELNEKWREFHMQFPLRVVSEKENLSDLVILSNKHGKEFYMQQIEDILNQQSNLVIG